MNVAVFWNKKITIEAKKKTSEECNLQQTKARYLIDLSDMANEEKAFSFHVFVVLLFGNSSVISRDICRSVLAQITRQDILGHRK